MVYHSIKIMCGIGGMCLWVVGCQSPSSQCSTTSAQAFIQAGLQDGQTGRDPRKKPLGCRVDGALLQAYRQGWQQGIQGFCQQQNPFSLGAAGKSLPKHCNFNAQNRQAFNQGLAQHCQSTAPDSLYVLGLKGKKSDTRCQYSFQQLAAYNTGFDSFCDAFPVANYGRDDKDLPKNGCLWTARQRDRHERARRQELCSFEAGRKAAEDRMEDILNSPTNGKAVGQCGYSFSQGGYTPGKCRRTLRRPLGQRSCQYVDEYQRGLRRGRNATVRDHRADMQNRLEREKQNPTLSSSAISQLEQYLSFLQSLVQRRG